MSFDNVLGCIIYSNSRNPPADSLGSYGTTSQSGGAISPAYMSLEDLLKDDLRASGQAGAGRPGANRLGVVGEAYPHRQPNFEIFRE